ncbi:MAG TPA: hypothetical protein VMY39_05990 [Planctomycetota bacterium]|nr:hypothetical protein [Planctomycetota bacterium]
MNAWMTLWTWVLIVGLAAFAVTAVVVGIGAIFDIRDLFRSLRERHETSTDRDGRKP